MYVCMHVCVPASFVCMHVKYQVKKMHKLRKPVTGFHFFDCLICSCLGHQVWYSTSAHFVISLQSGHPKHLLVRVLIKTIQKY